MIMNTNDGERQQTRLVVCCQCPAMAAHFLRSREILFLLVKIEADCGRG